MTTAILYRWRIKPGRDEEFRAAWAEGTRRIHEACASYGACLHRDEDGLFWSYARWPSEESRQDCFAEHDWPSQECFATMQDCIAERFDEIRLAVTEDGLAPREASHTVPVLTTKRLVLRPMALGDAEALYPALTDEENMRYWSRGPLESVEAVRDYLRWNIDGAGVQCLAAARRDAPVHALGWVILIDRKPEEAEIGYIFRPDAQGAGLAREAADQVVRHGFDVRGLRRIFADTDPDNAASIRLLESLGFRYEGRLRAAWKTHLGLRDSLIFARLSTD